MAWNREVSEQKCLRTNLSIHDEENKQSWNFHVLEWFDGFITTRRRCCDVAIKPLQDTKPLSQPFVNVEKYHVRRFLSREPGKNRRIRH
ncbi:hypothetical protein EPN81_03910 [Patescibacteria group bacterium]|nr:MAG: hypothetical protein EPN81_03910 [Patescibacteria group bacterium]